MLNWKLAGIALGVIAVIAAISSIWRAMRSGSWHSAEPSTIPAFCSPTKDQGVWSLMSTGQPARRDSPIA